MSSVEGSPSSAANPLEQRMPRIDSLTGMRWWAAFFVFGYHMLVFAPLPGPAAAFLEYGHFGVTFFFVLSGFVLTWSLSATVSQSTFYWRRFARVYPSHFVALLLAIPVFHSFAPDPADWWVKGVSVGILALSFVLLQGWSTNPAILFSGNPAAWTLTCEAFFYAVHPYISRILAPLRVRGALIVAGVVIVVAFGYRTLALGMPGTLAADLPLPLVRVTEFALGMALAWALRSGWRPRIPAPAALAVLAVCLAAIVLVPRYAVGSAAASFVSGYANELFTVACGLAMLALAKNTLTGRPSFLANAVFVRLGEWSFAFYLVHATFIYIALSIFGPRTESWWNLGYYALLLGIATAGAAALHHFVEKPMERRMRGWKDGRDAARRDRLAGRVDPARP